MTLDGKTVACWTFVANNVLAWEDDAGFSAWLQFVVLPGGPVFMGDLHPHDDQQDNASHGAVQTLYQCSYSESAPLDICHL